jgi:hypothetical protein
MNFLCISNYNNGLEWLQSYKNPYVIYDRSDSVNLSSSLKFIKVPNVGYNIFDMMEFIIANYFNLPDYTVFCKGNIFPRHITQERFDYLVNNKYYTALFQPELHNPTLPWAMFSSDGMWSEINNNWYMKKTKYFKTYNEFLQFCFKDPILPEYVTFCPGANYIVPKENILKYDIIFYKNLKTFVEWDKESNESHMVERFLHTMWTCNYKVSENMKKIY